MRSLKLLTAALPFLGVSATKQYGNDEIVIVTQTRTVTVCPLTHLFTCEVPTTYPPKPTTTGAVTTTSGAGHITTTSGYHNGTITTTGYNNGTTSSTSQTTTTTTKSVAAPTNTGIKDSECNKPGSRSSWCRGQSIDTDTHKTSFRTGKTVTYSLVIDKGSINFDGTPFPAFTVNGKTPGEPIIANWGDMVEITVTNKLQDNATTIHWHGIRQYGTNDQDGVPGVSECGIAPGQSRKYTWHASTYGTGWYHSHLLAQYGGGIRGPIIIHGPTTADYDIDMGSVMIDEKFADTIFNMAWNQNRIRGQLLPATNYLLNGKNRNAADTTGESERWEMQKGKKHLFRLINSSAQSGYAVHIDGHKMTVVSSDFTPVTPYEVDSVYLISGQRVNVIVEAKATEGAYYFRAINQNGCGVLNSNTGLSTANGIVSYKGHAGDAVTSSNFTLNAQVCQDENKNIVPHVSRGAGDIGRFQAAVKVLPGGNAAGVSYGNQGVVNSWYLGGEYELSQNNAQLLGSKRVNVTFSQPTLQTLAELPTLEYNSSIYSNAYVVDGKASDWSYFVIQNNFQTSHPMHLHGHDFSILGQGQGVFTADMAGSLNFANPPRRDTALLWGTPVPNSGNPPRANPGYTVIGFETDNPGAWLMHCHILWHAEAGMGLQFMERPKEINAVSYAAKPEFQSECAAYDSYISAGGEEKHPWESGLKKRHLNAHKDHVRHSL